MPNGAKYAFTETRKRATGYERSDVNLFLRIINTELNLTQIAVGRHDIDDKSNESLFYTVIGVECGRSNRQGVCGSYGDGS